MLCIRAALTYGQGKTMGNTMKEGVARKDRFQTREEEEEGGDYRDSPKTMLKGDNGSLLCSTLDSGRCWLAVRVRVDFEPGLLGWSIALLRWGRRKASRGSTG